MLIIDEDGFNGIAYAVSPKTVNGIYDGDQLSEEIENFVKSFFQARHIVARKGVLGGVGASGAGPDNIPGLVSWAVEHWEVVSGLVMAAYLFVRRSITAITTARRKLSEYALNPYRSRFVIRLEARSNRSNQQYDDGSYIQLVRLLPKFLAELHKNFSDQQMAIIAGHDQPFGAAPPLRIECATFPLAEAARHIQRLVSAHDTVTDPSIYLHYKKYGLFRKTERLVGSDFFRTYFYDFA